MDVRVARWNGIQAVGLENERPSDASIVGPVTASELADMAPWALLILEGRCPIHWEMLERVLDERGDPWGRCPIESHATHEGLFHFDCWAIR